MYRNDFVAKYSHRYTQAQINGEWFAISHFAKYGNTWKVWLVGANKLTELSEVSKWEYCDF